MREDFKHLLTERERHNSRWNYTKGHKKLQQQDEAGDYEDWAPGGKVSMKKTALGKSRTSKTLNENLSPLNKFLHGSVGRLWDEVFSEISEACPKDSAVNAHIYQHLFDFVILNPHFEDGKIYSHNSFGSHSPRYSTQSSFAGYVDGEGILRECPRRETSRSMTKKDKKLRESFEKVLSPTLWLVKLDGYWNYANLARLPITVDFDTPGMRGELYTKKIYEHKKYEDVYIEKSHYYKDDFLKKKFHTKTVEGAEIHKVYYGDYVYCQSLRRLKLHELRKHNLKNDF